MNPTLDLLVRLLGGVLFLALVAAVSYSRRGTDRAEAVTAGHDPRQCADCAPLRHPRNRAARKALAVIPRQTRGGGQ